MDFEPLIVNSDEMPVMPLGTKSIVEHRKYGVQILTRKANDLYIDDKRVLLHRVPEQKRGIAGLQLHTMLSEHLILNARVLDILYENPDIIPDQWKYDSRGTASSICFWGTIFKSDWNRLEVEILWFRSDGEPGRGKYVGSWHRSTQELQEEFGWDKPAAIVSND